MTKLVNENNDIRQCRQCHGEMIFTNREDEDSSLPWRERGKLFVCNGCQHKALIADPSTIITAFFSAIFILLVEGYALQNGLISFIAYALGSSIGFSVLAIFMVVVSIIFFIGAMLNLSQGLQQVFVCLSHPERAGESLSKRAVSLLLTLLLGALPWGIAIGLGLLNDQYFQASEWFGLIMLPLIFSPIFLAEKLNISSVSVFFSSVFYLAAGLLVWAL